MSETTNTNPTQEVAAMFQFVATVSASSAEDALAKVQKHLAKVDGFAVTGNVGVRSERHLLWNVEIANEGGNVDDCWVVLTSYGISPAKELGSSWARLEAGWMAA